MPEESDPRVDEILSRHELALTRLKDGLGLLGVSPCAKCEKFFRRTEPGTMFETGSERICYGCIREWWPQQSAQLSIKDRENLEGKLVFWLREHHHAELVKDPAKLPTSSLQELNIVANCLECRGTGKLAGEERCRYCDGRGTVWVIVLRRRG